MAETEDRAALLAEAYKRGILPPDVKASYEEAMSRGLVAKPPEAPQQSTAMQTGRTIGQAVVGFKDSALESLGALPDLVAKGMRFAGLPAPEEGFYTKKLKEGYTAAGDALVRPFEAVGIDRNVLGTTAPQNKLEKAAYGAGRGAADAAAIALPAAGLARAAPAGGVLQGVAQTMASQPAMQAVAGATGGAVGEATDNPLLGTAAALAVPAAAAVGRRIVTPVQSQLTPDQARLAQVAASEGINLSPAQRTGSVPLQTMESVMRTLPLTAGPQKAIDQNTARQFNRAVLSRAGIVADSASPQILEGNSARLGREFERLSASTVVAMDDQALGRLQEVATRYGAKLPSQQREVFNSFLDDILGAGDALPGRVYQQARSDLTRLSKSYRQSDPATSTALRGLRDALDDAADRSIPEKLRGAWDAARSQWAAQRVIEGAMKSGQGAQAAAGNIPPGGLKQAVANQDPRGFVQGRGQLADLSRVGEAFIRDPIPNSGTPGRENLIKLLQGGGAGASLMSGDPVTMIGGTAAALAGPRMAQMLYNTGPVERYLTNRLLPRPAGSDQALLASILAGREKDRALSPP